MATGCPPGDVLLQFLRELLSGSRDARVDAHVETCPACQAVLARLSPSSWKPHQPTDPTPPGDGSVQPTPSTRLPEDVDSPSVPFPTLPAELPGYEVLDELGRGGMGFVYKARDKGLPRFVALKVLPPDYAKHPQWLARFRREAATAASLSHPHICTVHDLREHQGRPFIVMEFIEGRTLRELAREGPPVERVVRLFGQAARALAAAHGAGIIHRDVKPDNIMAHDDGYAKVLDFGLARRLPLPGSETPDRGTDPGRVVGTPRYMSPEQARGEELEAATDIFSLGVALYELAVGQHPFTSEPRVGVVHAILSLPAPPASRWRPDVPAALDALLQKMLHKDARLRPTALEVAVVLEGLARTPEASPAAGLIPRHTVGRHGDRAVLQSALDSATAGRGLFVCVTGEAGIGKTTLVENFLDGSGDGLDYSVARGRCSERLAGTEAYLPVLEALAGLIVGPGGDFAARQLRTVGPAWYALANDPAGTSSSTQERLKRELAAFLLELGRLRPVVLFLDDLHWADASTVDLLAYLGGRVAGLRLVVVLTYRPAEMRLADNPFLKAQLEMKRHGTCREIHLGFLGRTDVEHYLALEYPGHRFSPDLAGHVHARTERNPLFMADLLRYLRDRGVITEANGGWELTRQPDGLEGEMPESVLSMIQKKLTQLSEADRRLLTVASVQGHDFDSAVAARVLGSDAADVEERLVALERVHALVRRLGEKELPDRTLTVRYAFVHVLYQNALYEDLQPTRKASWSAATTRALLGFYGPRSTEIAAELAVLFAVAREPARAAEWYGIAARNAAGVFAYKEAATLALRGLEHLKSLPEAPERDRQEMKLQIVLGGALQGTKGYSAPETGQAYGRARHLCQQLPHDADLFSAKWGLWLFFASRLDFATARTLVEELLAQARSLGPVQVMQAHWAMGVTATHQGELVLARGHLEAALSASDAYPLNVAAGAHGPEPITASLAYLAYVLWPLGYPDQASERARQAIARARALAHPQSLCMALHFAGVSHQRRGEVEQAGVAAAELIAAATEHELPNWLAFGRVSRGWTRSTLGKKGAGLAELRQGLTGFQTTAIGFGRMRALALLTITLAEEGQFAEAQAVLDEALAALERTGERFIESDLYRVQGDLLLGREAGPEAGAQAEQWFRRAIDVARRQEARSLELKAVVSLCHLYRRQGRGAEALSALAEVHARFTEGLGTADLAESSALLRQPPP